MAEKLVPLGGFSGDLEDFVFLAKELWACLESYEQELREAAVAEEDRSGVLAERMQTEEFRSLVHDLDENWNEAFQKLKEIDQKFFDSPQEKAEILRLGDSVLQLGSPGYVATQGRDESKFMTSILRLQTLADRFYWQSFLLSGSPTFRSRRTTQPGEASAKLIAALAAHHGYDQGRCSNYEAIPNNALARLAEVSRSTASEFFKKAFGEVQASGHLAYQIACRDQHTLDLKIRRTLREEAMYRTYGRRPPGEGPYDDGED